MNLTEFTAAVNALERAKVEKLNEKYRAGELLFGAKHHEYPESMLSYYFNAGMTPEQAVREIEAG